MKISSVILAVLVLLCGPALAQEKLKILDEYDRFADVTTISTDATSLHANIKDEIQSILKHSRYGLPSPEFRPSITLAVSFPGKEMPEKMPGVDILFMSHSKEWKYLRSHFVFALADGEPVGLSPRLQQRNVGRGYVLEIIVVSTPFSEFKKFYRASTIEFKVGATEFIPSQAEIDHINEFIEYCESKK